mmetsp:Transcript_57203/g.170547  ORF Transcript_57203/g.170547 Transcript_57203/m.170547 type:complete len:83 (-) Transcript_57203:102-350(-)
MWQRGEGDVQGGGGGSDEFRECAAVRRDSRDPVMLFVCLWRSSLQITAIHFTRQCGNAFEIENSSSSEMHSITSSFEENISN